MPRHKEEFLVGRDEARSGRIRIQVPYLLECLGGTSETFRAFATIANTIVEVETHYHRLRDEFAEISIKP